MKLSSIALTGLLCTLVLPACRQSSASVKPLTGPPQPGTKVYSPVFGEQACGMVMNAAPSPEGGADLLMVVQLGAIDGVVTLDRPEGPPLTLLPLPYEIPVNSTTRPKLS